MSNSSAIDEHQEFSSALNILEQAIDMHSQWLSKLHEHFICGVPIADDDILQEHAHHNCELGQWYYNGAPAIIQEYPEFADIEEVHRTMHAQARQMVMDYDSPKGISRTEYRQFINSQQSLLYLLSRLKERILLSANSFDELTGAVGRSAFQLLAAKTHAEAERSMDIYSLAMIDIDLFKGINDAHGHLFGDKVLRAVATQIIQCTRQTDTVCRFGGEEFLLLLPHTGIGSAEQILEKLRSQVEQRQVVTDDGVAVSVTISIGCAQWQPDQSFEQILEQADQGLYAAKQGGRNRVSLVMQEREKR